MSHFGVPLNQKRQVRIGLPVTAFSEMLVAQTTPVIQAQFAYGINGLQFLSFPGNGGSVVGANSMAVVSTGTNSDGFALILSNDVLKYNSGQGALARFSALFTTGVADSEQTAGLGNNLCALHFGYNGTDFGVLRRTDGQTEMRKLTVSTASTTAENITITLDGVAVTDVAVTNSGDPVVTAKEIADHNYLSIGNGWAAEVEGNEVTFFSFDAASHSGSYSLSGATTAVGSFAQLLAGQVSADSWIAQSNWNGDVMDGTGFSKITLDPTKGNVYQIRYEWLGFGRIQYSIQNPSTGEFIEVHSVAYSNANVMPSLDNPTMPLSIACRNLGNTSDLTVKSASMSALTEGMDAELGPNFSGSNLFVIGNVTTEEPILTIRSQQPFNGKVNQIRNEIISLNFTSNLNSATANTTFRIYINATPINGTSYSDVETGHSTTRIDTDSVDFDLTGAELLASYILSANDSQIVRLNDLKIKVAPPQTIMITAEASKGHAANEVGASISWKELI